MLKIVVLFLVFTVNCFSMNKYVRAYAVYWMNIDPKVTITYLQNALEVEGASCESAFILGSFYLQDGIFKKDLTKAKLFIDKAAKKSHRDALKSIADGYYTGDIREKNIQKALEYYERAGGLCCGAAQLNAAIVAIELKDLQKAVFWLKKASQNSELGELRAYASEKLREIS